MPDRLRVLGGLFVLDRLGAAGGGRRADTRLAARATWSGSRTRPRQTVVSIIPSVGNITFEMKVKGQNVLRWPYASVEAFKARPASERHSVSGAVGQPARRAGLLRQRQALRLRHGAGKRTRRDSHPRVPDHHRPVAGGGSEGRSQVGVGDEPARVLPPATVDEAVSVRSHDSDHAPARERRAAGRDPDREHERRADAARHRIPSILSVDRFPARRVATVGRRADRVAAGTDQGPHRRDPSDRAAVPGSRRHPRWRTTTWITSSAISCATARAGRR